MPGLKRCGLPEPVGVFEQPVDRVAHEELASVDVAVTDGLARHVLPEDGGQ